MRTVNIKRKCFLLLEKISILRQSLMELKHIAKKTIYSSRSVIISTTINSFDLVYNIYDRLQLKNDQFNKERII